MTGYDVTNSVRIAQNQSTSIENPNGRKVKEKLATNVSQKLNEKGIVSFIKNLFNPNRKIALTSLQKALNGDEKIFDDRKKFFRHLPKSTKKLFNDYLNSFPKEEKISQGKFNEIWNYISKHSEDCKVGEGGFGKVYQSKDGQYVVKVPKDSTDDNTDITGNESLQKGIGTFDKNEHYYTKNVEFITKYAGVFDVDVQTEDGLKYSAKATVFEKVDGKDFSECFTTDNATTFRLFAQAATAIAISHEAGCGNPDIKPGNMMITNVSSEQATTKESNLKLIDQGGVVDLTKIDSVVSGFTPGYAAPEIAPNCRPSPSADVFALGVSILDKLSQKCLTSYYQQTFQSIMDVFEYNTYQNFGESEEFLNEVPIENIKNFHQTKIIFILKTSKLL